MWISVQRLTSLPLSCDCLSQGWRSLTLKLAPMLPSMKFLCLFRNLRMVFGETLGVCSLDHAPGWELALSSIRQKGSWTYLGTSLAFQGLHSINQPALIHFTNLNWSHMCSDLTNILSKAHTKQHTLWSCRYILWHTDRRRTLYMLRLCTMFLAKISNPKTGKYLPNCLLSCIVLVI